MKACGALNTVGKTLRTRKRTRPSDEFKAAYKEEMKRLAAVAKKFGKDGIKEHLEDLGFGPGSFEPGTGVDVTGTRLDPMKHGLKGFEEHSDEKEDRKTDVEPTSGSFRDADDIKAFEGTVYYNVWFDDEAMDGLVVELSDKSDVLNDDWDVYASLAKKFEIDFPAYSLVETMEAVFEVHDSKGNWVKDIDVIDHIADMLEEKSGYEKGSWSKK